MMIRIKELKYLTLAMLLGTFVGVGFFSSCREQKKQENTEQQGEHPKGEEHPTKESDAGAEHPEGEVEEHPEGE